MNTILEKPSDRNPLINVGINILSDTVKAAPGKFNTIYGKGIKGELVIYFVIEKMILIPDNICVHINNKHLILLIDPSIFYHSERGQYGSA